MPTPPGFHKVSWNLDMSRLHRLDRFVAKRSKTEKTDRSKVMRDALDMYLDTVDPRVDELTDEQLEAMRGREDPEIAAVLPPARARGSYT